MIAPRHLAAPVLATACLTALLSGCASGSTPAATTPSPVASREAGVVTMPVKMCIVNGTTADLDIAPTGPYGEFAVAKPGDTACVQGDTTSGDPVVAITFADDSIIYAYGRNPVFGRPDIRLCTDQDCNTSLAQYDLSENASLSGTVRNVKYTASRAKDAGGYKQLQLRVG